MSSLNSVKKPMNFTHEGAPAKNINAEQELKRSVMSCLLWENSFYESGVSIADRVCELCEVVDNDKIADIARLAKRDMKLRHVPLLLLTELCRKGYNVRELTYDLVNRADDLSEILALYWREGKKPIAKSLLRGLADSFAKFDEYQLAKYKANKKAISLKDVMKLSRPKPTNKEQADLWGRLINNSLKTPDTWEVKYSLCKTDEEKRKVWEDLTRENKLGGLAALRNICNMEQVGFAEIKQAIKNINATKLLPINFIKAAENNPKYELEIEEKFLESFANKEKIKGRTVFLFDGSVSMCGVNENRQAGLAMIARELFEDAAMFKFGSEIRQLPSRRGFALKDLLKADMGGTFLGASIKLINEQIPHDRLIVITDEQSHDRVPDPITNNAYIINVDSYQNGIGYGKWVHVDGWSDKILTYIQEYENSI